MCDCNNDNGSCCSINEEKTVYKSLTINQDVCDYIERLNYEANNLKEVVRILIRNVDGLFNNEHYDRILGEYKLANTELSMTLNSLIEIYAPEFKLDDIRLTKMLSPSVTFATRELVFLLSSK